MEKVFRVFERLPRFTLSALAIGLLLVLTLMPRQTEPEQIAIPNIDKVAHALMFGLVCCAILMDFGRKRGYVSLKMIISTAMAVTALGGVIELAQQTMGLGRSGEWADFIADAAGAFLLPLFFRNTLQSYSTFCFTRSHSPRADQIPLEEVHRIYMESFPEEERRPWDDLKDKLLDYAHPLNIKLIHHDGKFAGFITWWDLDRLRYVEHFAVDPAMRGKAIGSMAMKEFVMADNRPVVLEVEPENTGEISRRRIAFYERCGFTAHHSFPYIQPPYSTHLPSVALTLMTAGRLPLPLQEIAATLHQSVYSEATGYSVSDKSQQISQ